MIEGVNAILISSSDVSSSVKFYKELGIPLVTHDHGGGQHAEADLGGCHFAIFPGGEELSHTPNVRFSLHTPDLESFYEELLKKGIKFTSPPEEKPFGGVTAELNDPDGNAVTLMRWKED